MRTAFPVQELPARNALTVEVSCVNRTRKLWRVSLDFLPVLLFLPPSATLEARAWGTSGEKKSLKTGNAFKTSAPGCPIWFCPAFGPVAGNLLAYLAGLSESSKLKARTLQHGKRVYLESADVAVLYHTIPTAEAVKILQASGIDTHYAQSPMAEKLKEHFVKCEKAMQSAKPILGKLHFPDDYRTVTVIGFISILVEHQEAFLLLVMREMFGSAFALSRPIVEGMYRALWLNACATDAKLKRFNEKDEIDLTLAQMADATDPAHDTGDFFQDFKKRAWKALNSYTHTGMLQIGRRFTGHEVANNYSEGEIYEMATTVTTCVLVVISRFLAKQGHQDDAKAIDALIETYGPIADSQEFSKKE